MTEHELKTWPNYFEPVLVNNKTFEIRKNDRNFKPGDILRLREWAPGPDGPETGTYTGRECKRIVTYILEDSYFVPSGYVCMGIRPIETPQRLRVVRKEGENVEVLGEEIIMHDIADVTMLVVPNMSPDELTQFQRVWRASVESDGTHSQIVICAAESAELELYQFELVKDGTNDEEK